MTKHCYRDKNRACGQNCAAHSPEANTKCHIVEWFTENYGIGGAILEARK